MDDGVPRRNNRSIVLVVGLRYPHRPYVLSIFQYEGANKSIRTGEGAVMAIEEGKRAPAFKLKDSEETTVSLKDFKGTDLIIYFYPRDSTPGCTKEACGFQALWDNFQTRGFEVIGISPDSPESHTRFALKYELENIRLLSDPDRKVMEKYDAYGEKVLYGKKTVGVIRSTVWVGKDGKVKKHWKRVAKAADHPAKVLAFISE